MHASRGDGWGRDPHTDEVTPLGPTWAAATGWDTVEDWVAGQLSARWGAAEGADYEQDGLCAEVREAVNGNLPPGWVLDGNRFSGPAEASEQTLRLIRGAIDRIDFWGMAQYYDNGD